MKRRRSKRLVIDTTVAQAAGEPGSTNPTSKCCREVLKAILQICHKVVMTREISEEWMRHQSRFTSKWRVSMEAKKKICRIPVPRNDALREKIVHAAKESKDCDAMLKDMHLIEAAIATDRIVISLDRTAVGLFRSVAVGVGEVRGIMWVNPEKECEEVVAWLTDGADSMNQDLFPL